MSQVAIAVNSAQLFFVVDCHKSLQPYDVLLSEPEEGPPVPPAGEGGQKGAPKSDWVPLLRRRDTRTELTKNWFHTLPFQYSYLSNTSKKLIFTRPINFLKPTVAKCIVNSFVDSMCLDKLAVGRVTFAESTLIFSIFSITQSKNIQETEAVDLLRS